MWEPSGTLVRAIATAVAGLTSAIAFGRPAAAVLAAPFACHAVIALLLRPRGAVPTYAAAAPGDLAEETAVRVRLRLSGADEVEQLTWLLRSTARLSCDPEVLSAGSPELAPARTVAAVRWGRAEVPSTVRAESAWGGFRHGPVSLSPLVFRVTPGVLAYETRASLPHPLGQVGVHASQRTGMGLEYHGTRAFVPGDRLRRINWRASSRSPVLQVDTTVTEDDAHLLLLVDAQAELAGPGGESSSAQLAVRVAATLAQHHLGQGDRVGLRVLARNGKVVGPGAGRRHLTRINHVLAGTEPAPSVNLPSVLTLPAKSAVTVVLLSPLLDPRVLDRVGQIRRSSRSLVVIDTLPEGAVPAAEGTTDPELARLAWRMRLIERAEVLATLERTGTPVVPWRGPGSLDLVLRQLSRVGDRSVR